MRSFSFSLSCNLPFIPFTLTSPHKTQSAMLFSSPLRAAALLLLGLSAQVRAMTDDMINSQVRLAYVGSTAMRVSWNTFTQQHCPTVYYGRSPFEMWYLATSSVSVTYNTSLTYNNHVTITGLQPDTTYYYLPSHMLQDNATYPPYTFRTSRVPGDGTPYSVAVVVDMGTMGPKGLTTSAGQTVSPKNILRPGEKNTIQSLEAASCDYDFLLQRKSFASAAVIAAAPQSIDRVLTTHLQRVISLTPTPG